MGWAQSTETWPKVSWISDSALKVPSKDLHAREGISLLGTFLVFSKMPEVLVREREQAAENNRPH